MDLIKMIIGILLKMKSLDAATKRNRLLLTVSLCQLFPDGAQLD